MTRIGDPEVFVEKQLLEAYGLVCEKFTKDEMRRGKTPDRRVYSSSSEFVFFLEVKEVAHDGWLGGLKQDPIFNRLMLSPRTASLLSLHPCVCVIL